MSDDQLLSKEGKCKVYEGMVIDARVFEVQYTVVIKKLKLAFLM
jgi:hypothetical protein